MGPQVAEAQALVTMTPNELRDHIKRLSPRGPVSRSLERSISGGGMTVVRYSTQKEHLLGWLSEYDGPGFYGVKSLSLCKTDSR